MIEMLVWLSVLAVILTGLEANIYCDSPCYKEEEGAVNQTLCVYPDDTPAPACGTVMSVNLTENQVDLLIFLHNKFRSNIALGNLHPQVPAQNMRTMHWDEEMAASAKRWAVQCVRTIDECRDINAAVHCGQNVGWKPYNETGDLELHIENWFLEVKNGYLSKYIKKYEHRPEFEHFTQLLWADTDTFGCGRVVYTNEKGAKISHLVCNYVGGNELNKPVYIQGKACRKCPKSQPDCNPKYRGLCENIRQDLPDAAFKLAIPFSRAIKGKAEWVAILVCFLTIVNA